MTLLFSTFSKSGGVGFEINCCVTGARRTNRGWQSATQHHGQTLSELGASEAVDEKVGRRVESNQPV